jgi:photosystem II stability/assembly factor-like uncharacterized protein
VSSTDGATWSVQASSTTESLYGVWCEPGSTGPVPLAVGHGGTIVQWYPNGQGWTVRTSGTTAWLRDVWGGPSGAFVVGHQGVVLHSGGGYDWTPAVTTFDSSINFRGVSGVYDGDATLVGSNASGSVIYTQTTGTGFTPMSAPSAGVLYAIGGSSAGHKVAVGGPGVILRHVASWGPVTSGTNHVLRGVWANDNVVIAVGHGGMILRSLDGGATWKQEASGTTKELFAVWGRSADDIYAVGAAGTILHYTP